MSYETQEAFLAARRGAQRQYNGLRNLSGYRAWRIREGIRQHILWIDRQLAKAWSI
jgi:hypothetical protein